ncbi:hypothetical protein [Phytoactinopolyspora endophytica]|uniref:hypothetical protein n=1 Tax=Phytoactinopolyspora endophytica TaxID=1642495 RepID=UPI00101BCA6D|nr:hypothetical protein [Phytoactinopolyspora endophytica]
MSEQYHRLGDVTAGQIGFRLKGTADTITISALDSIPSVEAKPPLTPDGELDWDAVIDEHRDWVAATIGREITRVERYDGNKLIYTYQ